MPLGLQPMHLLSDGDTTEEEGESEVPGTETTLFRPHADTFDAGSEEGALLREATSEPSTQEEMEARLAASSSQSSSDSTQADATPTRCSSAASESSGPRYSAGGTNMCASAYVPFGRRAASGGISEPSYTPYAHHVLRESQTESQNESPLEPTQLDLWPGGTQIDERDHDHAVVA